MGIALADEGEFKGRVVISDHPEHQGIWVGNEWFELNTQRFGDIRDTIRRLEACGIAKPVYPGVSWIVTPPDNRHTEGDSCPPKN